MQEGWKYYNHALVPTTAPHEKIKEIQSGFWNGWEGFPLFARWTTDFDCGYETNWWYVIKEAPFSIEELSAKRKKNIRQSLKKCVVKKIDPVENVKELFEVYSAAYTRYSKADNRKTFEQFKCQCERESKEEYDYWGGYSIETGNLIGFMTIRIGEDYVESCVAKYHPDFLKCRVSDAIHYTVLNEYLNNCGKKYLSSGMRNINHITNVQDYKIDNFNFKKAYCHLCIMYRKPLDIIIRLLYPFKGLINKVNGGHFVHQMSSVLRMEEIRRGN